MLPAGDVEDHAILLCSLLLGFGLDAYVVLGTRIPLAAGTEEQEYAWVMTRYPQAATAASAGAGDAGRHAVSASADSVSGGRLRVAPVSDVDDDQVDTGRGGGAGAVAADVTAVVAGRPTWSVVFWDPLTGHRIPVKQLPDRRRRTRSARGAASASDPAEVAAAAAAALVGDDGDDAPAAVANGIIYHRVAACFNHEVYYANHALQDTVDTTRWDWEDVLQWKTVGAGVWRAASSFARCSWPALDAAPFQRTPACRWIPL